MDRRNALKRMVGAAVAGIMSLFVAKTGKAASLFQEDKLSARPQLCCVHRRDDSRYFYVDVPNKEKVMWAKSLSQSMPQNKLVFVRPIGVNMTRLYWE